MGGVTDVLGYQRLEVAPATMNWGSYRAANDVSPASAAHLTPTPAAPGPRGPRRGARLTTAGGMPCGLVVFGARERLPSGLLRSYRTAAIDPDLSMAAKTDSHGVSPVPELPLVLFDVSEEPVGPS
jgi:hypothetical protein